MIPTSIDGTDITGATIDGTDVQEITVDGDTVFTAESLPIAYSNLIAWYPFDSSFYGGSDADDATALFNPGQSGDSTAYNGTVNGATYQSGGGGTDINAGANSGAFDFDGSNDDINIGNPIFGSTTTMTMAVWTFIETSDGNNRVVCGNQTFSISKEQFVFFTTNDTIVIELINSAGFVSISDSISINQWNHLAATHDGSTLKLFVNGTQVGSTSHGGTYNPSEEFRIGFGDSGSGEHYDGLLDDLRLYDTDLTESQLSQIVTNTPHP